MTRKFLLVMCALVLLIGALGMTASAEADVIILQEDTASITVTEDTYLNLNGYDVGSVTVSSGKLYIFDSQTDDFTVADGNYGKITTITGDFAAAEGYVMVNDGGYSFHKVEMKLTDMSLRAETVGLYCKSEFAGDEVVAQNVKTYGVALSVKGVPNAENLDDTCQRSSFADFTNGKATSTMLNGILKTGNAYLINKVNADTPVYANAYIEMKDGSIVFGEYQSRSLKMQVQGINGMWCLLTDAQKAAMKELFTTFQSVMKSWDLTGISYGDYADVFADPYTPYAWYKEFKSLSIARDNMPVEERRQLALDHFRLQLSYTWTPNMDFAFSYGSSGSQVELYKGSAYSGMVYAESSSCWVDDDEYTSNGGGNLLKMLKYYDPATGVLDLKAMGDPNVIFNTIGSHCNWGATWGWSRVSDNVKWLSTINKFLPSFGALKVGPYTYDESKYLVYDANGKLVDTTFFDDSEETLNIVKSNGDETMCQSYAAMDIADGFISSYVHHVMMCSGRAEITTKKQFNYSSFKYETVIDPDNSYIWVIDQNPDYSVRVWGDGTPGDDPLILPNGRPLYSLGDFDPYQTNKVNFGTRRTLRSLLNQGYIPFTIPEFVEGSDGYEIPVAEGWIGASAKENAWQDGKTVDLSKDLVGTVTDEATGYSSGARIHSDYIISNVKVEVTDPSGKVIVSNEPYVSTRAAEQFCHIWVYQFMDVETYAPYANKGNTIHIYAQVSTGEWVDVFSTELID